MKLNPEQREQLRLSLLRFMDNNASNRGMSAALLLQMARSEGLPKLESDDVAVELQYLADKELAQETVKAISPENPVWRITGKGRDFRALN